MSFRRPALRACDKALAKSITTPIPPKSQYCSSCRALSSPKRSSQEIKLSERSFPSCVSKPSYASRFSTPKYTTHRASFATYTRNMSEPTVHPLFEPITGTWQYIVADSNTKKAVIIDSVLNYDPIRAAVTTESADAILEAVEDNGYHVDMILETHAHADHLTAASYLQSMLTKSQGSKPAIGIGSRIKQVQNLFGEKYGVLSKEYETVFDKLWKDDDEFAIGTLIARAVHLPGHTPDHMGYHIGSNVFVGDSIFHVDIGSARADFPGGSAQDIFKSGRKLLALPEDTKIWVGHDYPPEGRNAPVPFATVKEHRENNKHLKDGTQEEEFVDMRRKRDATLAAPRLIHPSLQVNIRGGQLPAPSPSGVRMVHLPLASPPW
ncbi:hypothetical protein NW768_002471 [Fusarium equiseti]|uniref:Metallo-beta-lactamase domain-containing protein n=1 Tax=Fusarium equiseti TaxID=61235 RepID=A0ABQ8RNG5_FUSEQ|nr:hypothetical protein NW768_002471 [Fusarium equiseti]